MLHGDGGRYAVVLNTGGYSWVLPRFTHLRTTAAADRGPRCRAGAYVSGADGSNACPAGSTRIANQAACRTAAAAAGKTVGSVFAGTYVNYPPGCYYSTSSNTAYFNRHAVGAEVSDYQVLCTALVTTGAPPPHRCVRVCAPAWSAAQCVFSDAHVSHARVRDRVGVAALRQCCRHVCASAKYMRVFIAPRLALYCVGYLTVRYFRVFNGYSLRPPYPTEY